MSWPKRLTRAWDHSRSMDSTLDYKRSWSEPWGKLEMERPVGGPRDYLVNRPMVEMDDIGPSLDLSPGFSMSGP